MRKTKMEILQAIKEFIDESESPLFYKSDLRTKQIDPRTAEEFFRMIHFCQRKLPPITIIETHRNFIVQISDRISLENDLENVLKSKEFPIEQLSHQGLLENHFSPKLQLKFKCECGEIAGFPAHCGEGMAVDTESKILRCEFCKITKEFPSHCGKTMGIIAIKI
ncbi:MAG: hypothetical protein ACE5OZ_09910 [Candidatus Heimdallarchaeota archaeon]